MLHSALSAQRQLFTGRAWTHFGLQPYLQSQAQSLERGEPVAVKHYGLGLFFHNNNVDRPANLPAAHYHVLLIYVCYSSEAEDKGDKNECE